MSQLKNFAKNACILAVTATAAISMLENFAKSVFYFTLITAAAMIAQWAISQIKKNASQLEGKDAQTLTKRQILDELKQLHGRSQRRKLCKLLGTKGYGKLNRTEAFAQLIESYHITRSQFERAKLALST